MVFKLFDLLERRFEPLLFVEQWRLRAAATRAQFFDISLAERRHLLARVRDGPPESLGAESSCRRPPP